MKRVICEKIFRILLLIIIVISLSGCIRNLVSQDYIYNDSNYSIGNKAFVDYINEIDVDWILGDIYIMPSSNHELIIREDIRGNSEETVEDKYRMHYKLDGDKLDIKFSGSSLNLTFVYQVKILYIYLPSEVDMININNVSSDINISEVSINKLKIENISGDIELNKIKTSETGVNNVSGDIELNNSNLNNLKVNNVSGEIILFENDILNLIVESVSGNIGLTLTKIPNELSIETVSADITAYINKNAKLSFKFNTSSGDFICKVNCKIEENLLIINDGNTGFEIESVSGNFKIYEKK